MEPLTFGEQTKVLKLLKEQYETSARIVEKQLQHVAGSNAVTLRWGVLNQLRIIDDLARTALKNPDILAVYLRARDKYYAQAIKGVRFLEGESSGKE